ncbi:MAG: potassium-transporting ATPase subunit KdpC [Isosphaeraceae bacterium]
MFRSVVQSAQACLLTFVICSVLYPLLIWGFAQVAFPDEAAGSLVCSRDRTVIGSSLIAQGFAGDRYFHPRPSAVDYKADATGGSNLGPTNPDLHAKIVERAKALGATAEQPAPVDLVTASGCGLDPDISPEAAEYQAARVAAARKLSVDAVRTLVKDQVDRSWSILGAPARVKVLRLNLALDELSEGGARP